MNSRRTTSDLPPGPFNPSEMALRMEAILNATVDGIVVIDQSGRIELFNRASERIFGYKSDDVIGKEVGLLMPSPINKLHQSYVEAYLQTGKAKIIGIGREVQGRRADGSLFPMDLSVSETRMGDRHSFTGLVRDITERKLLEKAIVDASELERKQLGQDLHDTVSQHLAGLTMLTKVLQNKIDHAGHEDLKADASNISELAATALSQVKNISYGLYPVELERNGLGVALTQLSTQQNTLFGIDCIYTGDTHLPELDPSAAMHLYRIAQEAITNAIKHAEASHITVDMQLDADGDALTITVQDDGRGLPEIRKQGSGLGLAIMKYRASMIGSELDIQSQRGTGTQIRCVYTIE